MMLACTAMAHAEDRTKCPDVPKDASAADQALCWYERQQGENDACADDDQCLEHAISWCPDAALDDPRVANTCFFGQLRMGFYDRAKDIAEYMDDSTDRARNCREALNGMMDVPVVTNPKGGEVHANGQTYGRAPIQVRLPSPWWKQTFTVHFDGKTVAVDSDRIRSAFDASVCEMHDLVIKGPEPVEDEELDGKGTERADQPTRGTTRPGDGPRGTDNGPGEIDDNGGQSRTQDTSDNRRMTTAGWILTGTGAGTLVAAAVFGGIGLREENELDSSCGNSAGFPSGFCDPSADPQSTADRASLFSNLGWGFLGVGIATLGAGATLLGLSAGDETRGSVTPALRCGPNGCIGNLRAVF